MPYFEAQALWSSIFEIQRLSLWELTGDMDKFKTSFFMSIIFNGEKEYCTGMGYEMGAVEFLLETSFRMSDCYKQIIEDLCDFSATWTGYEALWLDECNLSDETVVSLNRWDIADEVTDFMFSGTTNPVSVTHCKPLPFTEAFADLRATIPGAKLDSPIVKAIAENFYDIVGNYVWN